MTTKKKTITICSSASFYEEVVKMRNDLKKMGYKVLVPVTALKMEKQGNYDELKHKRWYDNPSLYYQKTAKMTGHFRQIKKGDLVLIVNMKKKGTKGYIGGNVLLEMFYAWLDKKPIYILNDVSEKCGLKEEVMGMNPIFIEGDLSRIV